MPNKQSPFRNSRWHYEVVAQIGMYRTSRARSVSRDLDRELDVVLLLVHKFCEYLHELVESGQELLPPLGIVEVDVGNLVTKAIGRWLLRAFEPFPGGVQQSQTEVPTSLGPCIWFAGLCQHRNQCGLELVTIVLANNVVQPLADPCAFICPEALWSF